MLRKFVLNTSGCRSVARYFVVNLVATLILSLAQPTLAQTQQTKFTSASQASQALYDAVQNKDNQALKEILGGPELTSSGDEEADKLEREQFAQKYQEMHRLVREPDGSRVLYIGAENWPFPIPLVATDGKWRFDSDSGYQEIRAREVGENEATAIEVCQATNAEVTATHDPAADFAQRLVKSQNATNVPFHGYYFRVLRELPRETVVVAYPTDYRGSGVMTFVVEGNTVYERDLGPRTPAVAQKIQRKLAGKWIRVQ